MTSVVDDKCVKCLACTDVCPVDAFKDEGKMLVIDPDTCIDCGVCIPECPETAIKEESEADATWTAFNAEKAATSPEVTK